MKIKYTKYKILLIITFLAFFQFGFSNTTEDSLYFQVISMKNGLPSSVIMDFEQDSLGFLWIATNDGLCRYDGTSFLVFKHDPNNPNSLWNNNVENLYIDKQDNLWVMTTNGLNLFDLKQQTITRIYSDSESGALADNSPIDIVESNDGTLFIGSYYSGISYRNANSKKFKYLSIDSPDKSTLSSNNINCLELYNDSLLFIGYRDSGIDIYNCNTQTTQSLESLLGSKLCSENVKTLCKNGNVGLWIGTDKGLSYLNIKENLITNYPYISCENNFVVDNEILSLFVDTSDKLWIGFRRKGLVIVEQDEIFKKGKESIYFQYIPNDNPGSLSYRTIINIFEDRNNQIWLGTHGGGINFVESKNEHFGHVYHINNSPSSLSYNKVWGITEDNNGNIWIGTDGDGINVWNEKEGVIKNYRNNPLNSSSLSDNAVISALTDSKGRIWLGTYEGGLNRFNEANNSFIRYIAPQKIPVNDIRCIYEDEKKDLWVGMNRGGIAKYNENADKFETVIGTENYDVRSIAYVNDILWLGTYSFGLIKYDKANQTTESASIINGAENMPIIQTIYAIYNDKLGNLWLGTDNLGLCKFNIKTTKLSRYSEDIGLVNNKVHAILPDEYGNLWLSTNNGISRFNIEDEEFYNYDWHKGVQYQEFHNGSKLITKSGLFCFGGFEGMNYFNPKYFQQVKQKPNLQFTGFTVLNKSILPEYKGVIKRSIEYRPNVNLNYKHSFFTIAFQSIDFPFSRDARYEYMLDGYDNEWIKAGKQNIANYKNVPAGEYTFRVKTYQASDKLHFDSKSLHIYMAPPIWKTYWAYALYVSLLGLIAFMIFRYRVKQYQYKNRIAYEQKLREKQKKLHDERLEFFTNISHELRTPLTIISVALEELISLKNMQPKHKKNYETALKNSDRLKELINKLLEFRRVEKGMANLSVSKLNLNDYLPSILQDFRQLARNNKINLKLSLPLDEITLWIDQDKFSMMLNNLLSNAIKNTPEGGQIVLSSDEDENNIYVKVKDTGIGIEKTNIKKIFNRYYKVENKSTDTGIGLALTKKLMELHHGSIDVESVPDKGTRFILKFNKGKSHFSSNQLLISVDEGIEEQKTISEKWLNDEKIMHSDSHKILLLIDDNKEILDLLHDKFKNDYKTIKAQNGEEGIQAAKKFSPDLIISDIMMPGISGIEVCQHLKGDTTTSHIPIILLTAKGSETDEIEGLNTGADDYMSKPFKFSILKARVNTILENRKKIENYFSNIPSEELPINSLPNKEMIFLDRLNEYIINKCLIENISVFDMAADLGFSRTSLYRKVKSLTGMSINAFVRSVKIQKSAEYIMNGMNVSEAAYGVGFEDLKYFRECFKKQIGKNPSDLK